MRYFIFTNFPRADEFGSGARPHVKDMTDVIKLKFGLEVSEGPYDSMDGTTKIGYMTESPVQALELIRIISEKGIGSYWYDDSPDHSKGEVTNFGSKDRWDKPRSAAA